MEHLIAFVTKNKDWLAVLLSAGALLISTVALIRPWIKDWRENRNAIFQALQGDRKAIALVTIRVTSGEWDSRLGATSKFRTKLLQSLGVAAGLESSDRGKSYVLAAMRHIAKISKSGSDDALGELRNVEDIFQAYARSGADPAFERERLVPLRAIIQAMKADAQQSHAGDPSQASYSRSPGP